MRSSRGPWNIMPSLRSVQRAFAASLAGPCDVALERHIVDDGVSAGERLEIYRNSCRGVIVGALRLTYPAIERLVGAEFFGAAAGRFVEQRWPSAADLNEYGAEFCDFIEGFEPAQRLVYLGDVARFEWALSSAAHAEDTVPLDLERLAALEPARHAGLRFRPHPSLRLLSLQYPADHIADAVLAGDETAMREMDPAARSAVKLVVHRGSGGVRAHRTDDLEFALLQSLLDGVEWSRITQQAGAHASSFLAQQIVEGRLIGFETEGA